MTSCVENYKKISKKKAKELFLKGEVLHFLPSMANPCSPWISLQDFPKEGDFTNTLNTILIYQPRELGRAVNFYIPL